jgi:hypothetical protein
MVDEPCAKEHVELTGGLFKAVEAALEVTNFGRAIVEAEGLADVYIFPDGSAE